MIRLASFALSALLLGAALSAVALAGGAGPDDTASYASAAIRSFSKHQGDYLPAHTFKLYVDGALVGGFKDVQGLEADFTARKLPGATSYQPITLVGGFIADPAALPPPDGSKAPTVLHRYSIIHRDLAARTTQRLDFDGYADLMKARDGAFDVTPIDALRLEVDALVFRPARGEAIAK